MAITIFAASRQQFAASSFGQLSSGPLQRGISLWPTCLRRPGRPRRVEPCTHAEPCPSSQMWPHLMQCCLSHLVQHVQRPATAWWSYFIWATPAETCYRNTVMCTQPNQPPRILLGMSERVFRRQRPKETKTVAIAATTGRKSALQRVNF